MTYRQLLLAISCATTTLALTLPSSNDALFTIPKGWQQPTYNFSNNPLSREKIALGHLLFYDPILSGDSTISCASCHSPYNAFTHVDHDLSHGIGGKIGTRNSPALMNLAWHSSFMWDGAINHLDMQALAPISHPAEMGENIAHVAEKLQGSNKYPALFYKSFGDSTVTGEHILKAIAQFLLTIVSANAKYDRVMRKETQFNEQEKNGYRLFRQHCATCHREPLFTNLKFANNGLKADTTLNDLGRMKVTNNPADSLQFKVPTLRNIEFSYPYMHDGRFKKLSEVIQHYTSGIEHNKTIAKELAHPIVLSSNQKTDLIAFLLTLSDKEFLFNPKFAQPAYPIASTNVHAAPPQNKSSLQSSEIAVLQDSFSEILAIQMNNLTQENFTIGLYDISGKLVQKTVLYQGSTIAYFDTRTLYAGEYIIRIIGNGKIIVKKITLHK